MRFARFFVDRPIFATVLSVLITLIGGIAYLNLPVAQYPEIAPPTIVVRATYPGADAETVAATVAAPLEEQINGVEGMLYMSSYSSADGVMSLTITFKLGTDLNSAQVLVQNRVSTAIPRLPTPVTQLGVTTTKSSPDFLMVVHLLSPDDSYDQLYVSNYARNRIRDQLLRLDGVGDITIFGERLYSLRIWLDPDKLASYGLTPSDVVAAVREQNVQVSGGSLGAQPAPKDAAFQLTVTTQGRFQDPAEFRRIIVRAREGRIVRLQDVARIELGAQDYATGSYLNGKPAVGIAVFQRPNTNALSGAKAVIEQMEQLKRDFPKGIEYRIVYNPTEYIQASVDAVYKTLVEAMLLVVLVVIVFLQSWRTAIIPIIAIPVSLIGTCAIMAALGYSLNNLTLFGLVLAIGIVVDDAIVVVENIERNIAQGLTPNEAAHRTMDEVGTAVIAIALVLAAVFVPTAFIPGITGQFYRQFALTIAVSTVISAFVSLTLSPALAALLLKPHDPHHRSRNPISRAFQWSADKFNGGFDRLAHGYAGAVGFVARRKLLSLAVYGGLLGLTWWVTAKVPTGFIPPQDQGYAIVVVQLPDGASLTRTEAALRKVADIVRAIPGVANTVEISGLNGATFSSASNSAVVFATLKSFDDRAGKPAQRDLAIIGQIMQRIGGIEEAFVIAVPPPPVRGLGNQGGFKIQLQDRDGADVRRVLAAAYAMMGAAQQTPGLAGVFTTFTVNTPQIYLEIDRTKAQMLNVPIGAIFDALQNNLGSAYVNDFNAFGRVYQVRLSADERFRIERDSIARLRVRSADGALIPLGTLVEIKDVAGPSLVQRYNMYTSVPLQGNAAPGVATGTALNTMEELAKRVLPPGIGIEWTELAYQERTTGNTAIFIFALSVVFVFLVLAAQYESWALPLAIVLIVPMSVMSALLGVMARGMDNNVLTQIGLVVLIGLAAKNAILIVEFARQAEAEGMDPVSAVIEACRLRLRPILMTAFAFILGVVPLAFASGAGAEMRQALGTAVLFGMIGVTLFGLLLTPVFYVSLRWLVTSVRRKPRPPRQDPPQHEPPPIDAPRPS